MATTNPFGELLVRLRKQAGMSRSQLSEASELSYPYISQLETGQRSPSRKSVWTIARALSVDPSVLEGSVPADDSDPEALERAALSTSDSMARGSERVASLMVAGPPAQSRRGAASSHDDLIGDILDLLDELPAGERVDALAEVQKRAMQRMLDEGSRRRR